MAKIKKIKLGSTTYDLCDADALHSHQTIKQDGITGATVNRFGTCTTGASTPAKTVSITTGTFSLEAGAKVTVKFTNANTAGTPTLNVNSKGAKNIFHKGSQITTGSNKALLAGVVEFIYDGIQFHLIGNYIDSNTTYSSKTAASGGTDVSLVTTGEKYTWNNKSNLTIGTTSTTAAAGNHTHSSYVNQNAFSNVTVGSTTITADSATDTITLAAGSNVTLTPDATNDKVTIAATIPAATSTTLGGVKLSYNADTQTLTISV